MAGYLFEGVQDNIVHDIGEKEIDYLFKDNQREEQEGQRVTHSANSNQSCMPTSNDRNDFYKDILLRDPQTAGYLMQYPHGIVIEQSMRRNYYRGENQLYKASVPSLLRTLNKYETRKEKELYRIVADMRVAEFALLIGKFEHVRTWKFSDVQFDVIAQHYGFQTNWLDITSDFNVAMFFATCYYDGDKWQPLSRKQTESDETHQYGMIFHAPSWQMSGRWAMADELFSSAGPYNADTKRSEILEHPHFIRKPENIAFPIGFQPFMRCHMQNGYAIYMRESNPLQQDSGFEKLRFRHSEEISNKYFDLMEGGKKIYPHEGLVQVKFILDELNALTTFSEDAFQYGLVRSHYYRVADEDQCRRDLSEFEVEGNKIKIQTNQVWSLSSGRKKRVDRLYKNFDIESWYGMQVRTRTNLCNGPAMFAPWMLPESDDEPGIIDFIPRKTETFCDDIWSRDMTRILCAVEHAQMPDF